MNKIFEKDLNYSLDLEDDKIFNEVYYKKFPHLKRIETITDIARQRKGIDKILHLHCGKKILIDEKKRRKDYGDILIEEYSDLDKKKVGWISREKYTDYIVYFVMPSKKVYFLPFILMQLAWIENYEIWKNKYGRKIADNKTYKTSNIPVPLKVLTESLIVQMKSTF